MLALEEIRGQHPEGCVLPALRPIHLRIMRAVAGVKGIDIYVTAQANVIGIPLAHPLRQAPVPQLRRAQPLARQRMPDLMRRVVDESPRRRRWLAAASDQLVVVD